jgi:hypothetical protein
LAQRHLEQWAAEDACRDHLENDELVARAKRAIDQLNAERSGGINEIDAWAAQHLTWPLTRPCTPRRSDFWSTGSQLPGFAHSN